MATGLDRFAAHLTDLEGSLGEFQVKPHYNRKTNSLSLYLRDESSYEKQVTQYLTVFLSNNDDSLVGIEIKKVTVIMKAISDLGEIRIADPFHVKDEDGESLSLDIMVRCALVPEPAEPINESQYAELDSATRGVRIGKRQICGT